MGDLPGPATKVLSGQVPAKLDFDPGEALRLTRWGDGPDIDHLAQGLALRAAGGR